MCARGGSSAMLAMVTFEPRKPEEAICLWQLMHCKPVAPAACMQGDVANFVETEQLIEIGGDGPPVISSFVVVRGSIPLLWSQIPNIKYKPTTLIAPLQTCDAPFDRHIRELLEKYKVRLAAA